MELTLGDGVCFGNDGNYVDLKKGQKKTKKELNIKGTVAFIRQKNVFNSHPIASLCWRWA